MARTLDDLLDASGLTHVEIGRRARLHRYTLWRLRQGRFLRARKLTVSRIARAVGVSPAAVEKAIAASYRAAQAD